MHLLRTQAKSLDEIDVAVDLEQTPAETVFLSFTDSDLAIMADAWERAEGLPSLRVASLAQLRHPHSVDLYVATVAAFGSWDSACHAGAAESPRALLVFYRSVLRAADAAPILALADALARESFDVSCAYVTSLKDPAACAGLANCLANTKPDVVLNTTAFAARQESGGVLDTADAPVLQVILAGSSEALWRALPRGLGAADLAMN